MDAFELRTGRHFRLSQSYGFRFPGYLFVESLVPLTRIGDIGPEARAELHDLLADAEKLAERLVAPERVYVLRFGEEDPTVHFHVVPRTRRLLDAYLADVDDEPPFSGAAIVAWLWRNAATLGFTDADVRDFVTRARAALRESGQD